MATFYQADQDVQSDRPSFAITNMTGGVGKTTMTRVIEYVWAEAGLPLRTVAIDATDDKRSAKLARLIDGAEQMLIEASDQDVAAAGKEVDAQMEHWNRIGHMLSEGGQLFDFGANAQHRFTNWARKAQPRDILDDAPILNVIVPVTAMPQAAVDGLWTLRQFLDIEPVFMRIRPVVVYNGVFGLVEKAVDPDVAEFRRFVEQRRIPIVTLGNGTIGVSERFSYLELATSKPR